MPKKQWFAQPQMLSEALTAEKKKAD